MNKTKHDGDCSIYMDNVDICTCGFFHDLIPQEDNPEYDKIFEQNCDALHKHEQVLCNMQNKKYSKDCLPKVGDTKIVKKFLFFPYFIANEVKWLQRVKILKQYQTWTDFRGDPPRLICLYGWISISFL